MSLINRIVNTGVKEEFPFPEKRKIILLNYLCIIASFILLAYLPFNYVLGLPSFFYAINLLGQFIVLACIWLNYKGKYGVARIFASVFLLLFINSFCLLTGEGTGVEYINIVLFFLPMVIFDSRKMIALFSISAVLCFILCKCAFTFNAGFYSSHITNQTFFWISMSVVFFTTFYVLNRFKKEVVTYTKLVEVQHEELSEKNKEIDASLRYARQIQFSLFFDTEEIKKILPNSFGLLLPYGIVSGDFYWVAKADNKIFMAVADCTGHGIPAALMTIVGHNLFNEGLNLQGLKHPGDLLAFVHKNLLSRLKEKTSKELSLNDGMDVAVCSFDFEGKVLEYAGANRPLYMVRKGELLETSPTKCSLGGHTAPDQVFVNEQIMLAPGDHIYLFTDGISDQHGGAKGKRYTKKRLKELLVSIESLSLSEKKDKIEKTLTAWKGKYPKTDDSFLMGVEVIG